MALREFLNQLIVTPQPDGRNWRVIQEFDYEVGKPGSGEIIKVPAEFITDFASIPWFLWSILPYWGKYGKASVVHDYLYQTHSRTKSEADRIFLEGMIVEGTPEWKAKVMYWAVRLFGYWAYNSGK